LHKLWLGTGKWGLECFANLAKLPPAGATVFVGAPKVLGASGGPTRGRAGGGGGSPPPRAAILELTPDASQRKTGCELRPEAVDSPYSNSRLIPPGPSGEGTD